MDQIALVIFLLKDIVTDVFFFNHLFVSVFHNKDMKYDILLERVAAV